MRILKESNEIATNKQLHSQARRESRSAWQLQIITLNNVKVNNLTLESVICRAFKI